MKSLRTKVFVGVLFLISIIILCMAIVFYQKEANMIQEDYYENFYYRTEQVGKYFDSDMKDVYEEAIELSYDQQVQKLVADYQSNQDTDQVDQIANVLKSYKKSNKIIDSVCIYFKEEQEIITSEEYPVVSSPVKIDLKNSTDTDVSLIKEPFKADEYVFSYIHPLELEGTQEVYVLFNIQERYIFYNYLDHLKNDKVVEVTLINSENRIVSTKEVERLGTNYSSSKKPNDLDVSLETTFTGLAFKVVVSGNEVLEQLKGLKYYMTILCLILLMIVFVVAFFSTKVIYKPLGELTEVVKEVGEGDLKKRALIKTDDEVGVLADNFNKMLDQINLLFEKLIREENLKKDAELEALQYQITPHFMYNTLNTIKCFALMRSEEEIAELLEDFIDLLQEVVSKKGSFITLADEVNVVGKYVRLQQFRNGNTFSVNFKIEGDANLCYIPRLILQPFVENSIMHGFNMREEGNEVEVKAYIKEERLNIFIEDNGTGMTEEKIKEIIESPKKKVTGMSRIGMANVMDRLHLYFKEEAKVDISRKERGMKIRITMPVLYSADLVEGNYEL